uniref:Tetraspanin n=1 Tax=Callorhinchus milii TaxID=7868 RepID=A0A4W3I0E9_CALMI
MADCGVITSKTVLLFLSLIFWVAGAVLTYVAAALLSTYKNYANFFHDQYTVLPASVILGVALLMFGIGIIGCCSTLKESPCGLGLFLFILLLIFTAEVTAFVMAVIFRKQVHEGVDGSMTIVFKKYDGTNADSRAVDYLQKEMQCCGVNNYTYWLSTEWFAKANNYSVPISCCRASFSNCTGSLNHTELINTKGCENKLQMGLESILSYAVLVILVFAIIKVLFVSLGLLFIAQPRSSGSMDNSPSLLA